MNATKYQYLYRVSKVLDRKCTKHFWGQWVSIMIYILHQTWHITQCEKTEIYFHLNFRENTLQFDLLSNKLSWQNFYEIIVRGEFCNFCTVTKLRRVDGFLRKEVNYWKYINVLEKCSDHHTFEKKNLEKKKIV